jgi:hypothetical protein
MKQDLTVYDMLQLPFYHPTLEEGLYSLLLDYEQNHHIKNLGI